MRMLRFASQGLREAKNPGSANNNCGGHVQSSVPEFDGPKPGSEVKTEVHDVRRDKTKVIQSAGLNRLGSPMPTADPAGLDADLMNAPRDTGVSESSRCGTPGEMNLGTVDAAPEVDGLKLGNEVKAEMHDVRRDTTKAGQSAGPSGTMEIERPRYAAEQPTGVQARPRCPIPTATGLDADLAAMRVPESSMRGDA